jgi:hypothetical protein
VDSFHRSAAPAAEIKRICIVQLGYLTFPKGVVCQLNLNVLGPPATFLTNRNDDFGVERWWQRSLTVLDGRNCFHGHLEQDQRINWLGSCILAANWLWNAKDLKENCACKKSLCPHFDPLRAGSCQF